VLCKGTQTTGTRIVGIADASFILEHIGCNRRSRLLPGLCLLFMWILSFVHHRAFAQATPLDFKIVLIVTICIFCKMWS
jgi:hypothetical protein